MQIKRKTVTEECKKEQKVLEITEEEFQQKCVEAGKIMIKRDKESEIGTDPIMMMALTISYTQVLGKLHRLLFNEEEET